MENMRQCPFDELHLIEEKRFSIHIVKCQRQHPDIKLARCPLDTSHLMREEELPQHMKSCPARGQIDVYKYSVTTAAASRVSSVPDPADDLIINTSAGPTRRGGWAGRADGGSSTTVGSTLLDDSECWDDSDCKAYNPLEKCIAKKRENSSFIVPKVNQFVEQSTAAAVLKGETKSDPGREDAERFKREPSSDEDFGSSTLNERQNDLEQFGLRRNAFHGTGTDKRVEREVKQEPRSYGGDRGSREREDRHSGEWSGSRRYDTAERGSYGGRPDGKSYRDRERHSDGYTNRGWYDGNDRDRHRRDRYDSDSKSYREYGRREDEDGYRSNRSQRNDRYEPYGSSYGSRDGRSGRTSDYPKKYPKYERE